MERYNAKWSSPETIDYEYDHPELGRVPSTCAAWDDNSYELFMELAAELGPYDDVAVQPPPEEVLRLLPAVSHAQIVAILIEREIITMDEGVGWLTGTLPAAVAAVIAQLPAEHQTIATLRAIRPTLVYPTDMLVAALAASKGIATEGLIEIFTRAYTL